MNASKANSIEKPIQFSSVQSFICVRLFATLWTTARQASLSINNSQSLLKLISVSSMMPSNHVIICRSFLLLPSILPSISVFSNDSGLCIRWPKYWNSIFSISPSNKYSGLITFRIDCFDLLSDQGALKSFLQLHSSKASILRCSAFFIVQISHPYMATGKNHSFDETDLCWQSNTLLYRILLFSVKHQHESAIGIHISLTF